jgi:hypothetical protein
MLFGSTSKGDEQKLGTVNPGFPKRTTSLCTVCGVFCVGLTSTFGVRERGVLSNVGEFTTGDGVLSGAGEFFTPDVFASTGFGVAVYMVAVEAGMAHAAQSASRKMRQRRLNIGRPLRVKGLYAENGKHIFNG